MRDFRLPNVLSRHGVEGDYFIVDMEYAGPDCTEWSIGQVGCKHVEPGQLHDAMRQSVVVSVARNVSMSTTVLSLQALLEFL